MPGFFTDYANNKMLDAVVGSAAIGAPATFYVGLSQNAANKAGSLSEPSGGSYARVAITNNLTNWPAAVSGAKSNATAVTFAAPTGSWGTVTSLFLADASSGGNVWAMSDLTVPKTLGTGSQAPVLAIGAFFVGTT
jgi:hypothetical protein